MLGMLVHGDTAGFGLDGTVHLPIATGDEQQRGEDAEDSGLRAKSTEYDRNA
jgi:hypothetical protein